MPHKIKLISALRRRLAPLASVAIILASTLAVSGCVVEDHGPYWHHHYWR